jgi:hypothetical protein
MIVTGTITLRHNAERDAGTHPRRYVRPATRAAWSRIARRKIILPCAVGYGMGPRPLISLLRACRSSTGLGRCMLRDRSSKGVAYQTGVSRY